MKKSIAVLGLGKYGRSLAESLYAMGMDVLVADKDEERIKEFAAKATVAVCADLEDESVVKELGLKNMDIVVIAMGSNLGASIMAVAVAKEQGVPFVMAKASSERMASILSKVGVDKIVDPEGESGMRTARVLTSTSYLDFFNVDDNLCMVEMNPKDKWVGKSIKTLNLRKLYNLNVVAMKKKSGAWSFVDPDAELTKDITLLIALEKKDLKRIQ
ncbi:MAG: TrkA family potassium uptake protein [Acetatifactor sp.]|nr:TrkA family potassium uptake protein [Acetatifactor sp.]